MRSVLYLGCRGKADVCELTLPRFRLVLSQLALATIGVELLWRDLDAL